MAETYTVEATREGSEIVSLSFEGKQFKKGDRVVLKSKEEMLKEYGDYDRGIRLELKNVWGTQTPANWGHAPKMIEWAEEKIVFVIKKIDRVFVVLEGAEEEIPETYGYTYTVAMVQHEKEQTKDFWESLEVL